MDQHSGRCNSNLSYQPRLADGIMGKKKAKSSSGKGKKSAGCKSKAGGLEAMSSLASSLPAPNNTSLNDVSPLLFNSSNGKLQFDLPYIGPISLAENDGDSSSVVHGMLLQYYYDYVVPEIAYFCCLHYNMD